MAGAPCTAANATGTRVIFRISSRLDTAWHDAIKILNRSPHAGEVDQCARFW